MKFITKNLLLFTAFFLFGTIAFRYSLSYSLSEGFYNAVWAAAVVYFFFNFAIGWIFGKRDHEYLPLYDVGFRFHFAAYLVFMAVSLLWFYFDFNSVHENIRTLYFLAIFWGIGLLINFILYRLAARRSIKGLNKNEIFE